MATKKPKGRYTKGPLPSDFKHVTPKELRGEVFVVPAGLAKEILKKAIASALAKRAASGQSSKALIKTVLENKQVQKIQPTQQDVAKELYNFYKRNPKYDLTVKTVKGTPVKKSDVIAGRAAAKAERIRAGISPTRAKPKVSNKGSVTEKGKAAAIARNTETKRQAAVDAQNAPTKQGQTIRGKFYPEPRPGYAGKEIPGKSINAREPKVSPEKPTINELGAFTKLTDAEKKIFLQSDKDAIQAVINAAKKIKDAPKPTKPVDVNKRLFEASKKLTPAQLKKIQEIVAETRRRAGA